MKRMLPYSSDLGPTNSKIGKQQDTDEEIMSNHDQFDDDDAPPDLDEDDTLEEANGTGGSVRGQETKCERDARIRLERKIITQQDSEEVEFGDVIPPLSIKTIDPEWRRFKGIQGHYNSCYLDATLFAMFTFTSIFDHILNRPCEYTDIPKYQEVQNVLREGIVNPLRTSLFVPSDNVMTLRHLLDELSSLSGMTTDEKDPEEFLSTLLAQILRTEPFLKMTTGESYFYQLFIEKDERLNVPTVQQLFEQSFHNSNVKFKEVPPCLLIQMPRFGTSFRLYPRIIPSQVLDITDIIENAPQVCYMCGSLATHDCDGCKDNSNSTSATDIHDGGLETNVFCSKCVAVFHRNAQHSQHKLKTLTLAKHSNEPQQHKRELMQLFAVVCIETSHYVSFVKCGQDSNAPWCFFDSMSDRVGESDGYNIPSVIALPDMPKWLLEENNAYKDIPKRELPEHARRLISDAYICMYQRVESSDIDNVHQ